jgi:hypothetical protein
VAQRRELADIPYIICDQMRELVHYLKVRRRDFTLARAEQRDGPIRDCLAVCLRMQAVSPKGWNVDATS